MTTAADTIYRLLCPPPPPEPVKTAGQVACEKWHRHRGGNYEPWDTADQEAWEAAARAVLAMREKPKALPTEAFDPTVVHCSTCERPATCYGTYEGVTGYACDTCCGHGNEDGHCTPMKSPKALPTEEDVRAAGHVLGPANGSWHIGRRIGDSSGCFGRMWEYILPDGGWIDNEVDRRADFPTREAALEAWGRRKER